MTDGGNDGESHYARDGDRQDRRAIPRLGCPLKSSRAAEKPSEVKLGRKECSTEHSASLYQQPQLARLTSIPADQPCTQCCTQCCKQCCKPAEKPAQGRQGWPAPILSDSDYL